MTGVPSRAARTAAAAATGVVGAAGLVAVALRDPHVPGSWGTCPVLALTGLPCPGCGGLRATADLLAGRPLEALGSNALAVVLVLGAGAVWAVWALAAVRGRPSPVPRLVAAVTDRRVAVGAVLLVAFTVLRWLPGTAPLLAP